MARLFNIMYCVPNLSGTGGMEKIILAKANYFADVINYDVTIIVSELNNNVIPFHISPKINLIDLKINQYTSNKIKGYSFLKNIGILKKIYTKQILNIKPDLIIVPERGYEDFFINSICKDIPKIREYHFSKKASSILEQEMSFMQKTKSRIIKNLYFNQFKKYDSFVALTEQDKKEWSEIKNVTVIPNYLESSNVKQNDFLKRPKRVISVGSMHNDRKGFSTLIKVWSQLKEYNTNWNLHIYGDGPYRSNLQALINNTNMQESIFLEGNTSQITKKYQESQLFLFASKGEGLPMVLLEAHQNGLPIISFNCYSGPSDILTSSNKGGYLIDVNDQFSFIENSKKLLGSETTRKTKSDEAYINSKRFNQEEIIPLWINLFEKITK